MSIILNEFMNFKRGRVEEEEEEEEEEGRGTVMSECLIDLQHWYFRAGLMAWRSLVLFFAFLLAVSFFEFQVGWDGWSFDGSD